MGRILKILCVVVLIIIIVIGFGQKAIPQLLKTYIYPKEFSEQVEKYSLQNELDTDFVYAVIKTESSFNENATSQVGARGLMQLMPDAFDWVKYRLSDDRNLTFDDMYNSEYNIEYGCYLLGYLYKRYGSHELAAAAYHAGMGAVDGWIEDGLINEDSVTHSDIPASQTSHYVKKIMRAYNMYKKLYK